MNITPIQERRLQQVKDEIVFLEKEDQKKGWLFVLILSLVQVILIYLLEYLFHLLTDKKSFVVYLQEYGWLRFFTSWIFWLLFDYVVMVSGKKKQLKLKKWELLELNKRYGLTEETVS